MGKAVPGGSVGTEDQDFRHRNNYEPCCFADRRTASADGCRNWQLCTQCVLNVFASLHLERRFSALVAHGSVPSQRSLWPDRVAESELLPIPT